MGSYDQKIQAKESTMEWDAQEDHFTLSQPTERINKTESLGI